MSFGLVTWEQVKRVIDSRPPRLDLIITGRYALNDLLESADLVSIIEEGKHHYQKGITARPGIEY